MYVIKLLTIYEYDYIMDTSIFMVSIIINIFIYVYSYLMYLSLFIHSRFRCVHNYTHISIYGPLLRSDIEI